MSDSELLTVGSAGVWIVIPDYDHLTAYGQYRCTVSGETCPPGDVVFRPPMPDDIDGYHDVSANAIRQAAEYLGWVAPELYENLREINQHIQLDLARAVEQLQESRDALATVTRENVRLQDEIDALNEPVFADFEDILAAEEGDDDDLD